MSNQHITAALRCSHFKGTTRLVLLVLADAASPGPKSKEDKTKILPFGYCKRRLATIMALVNCKRQPTVSAAISELKAEGAIKQWLKKKDGTWQVPLYFVDLDWLKKTAYSDEELDQFGYTDKRKATNGEESTGEPRVTDAPYGDPTDTLEEREPFNGEYENRLTVDTKSVRADYENRLTSFPPCSTSDEGLFPPAEAGTLPTAADAAGQASRTTPLRGDDSIEAQEASPLDPCLVALKSPLAPVHQSLSSPRFRGPPYRT